MVLGAAKRGGDMAVRKDVQVAAVPQRPTVVIAAVPVWVNIVVSLHALLSQHATGTKKQAYPSAMPNLERRRPPYYSRPGYTTITTKGPNLP